MKINTVRPTSPISFPSFAAALTAASLTLTAAFAQPPPRPAGPPPGAPQPAGPRADPAVIDVERALAQRGLYKGPMDGILTPEVSNAIRAFQREHRLEPTGQINPPLMHALGIGGPPR